MPAPHRLRVGSVPYLVARPLDWGLEHEPGVELERDVPARLVEGLREGRLDIALVSSIELFRRPGYRYLSGLGIAGERNVRSVQIFLRKPIEEVRRIALDPASRTGAALSQVVLHDLPGRGELGPPEFVEVDPGEDPERAEADAWLRIGDRALRDVLAPNAPPSIGPSQLWRDQTGFPCVFAVWVARPEVDLEPWRSGFARARDRGLARIEELAVQAAREWRVPVEECLEYLSAEIRYTMDPLRQSAALMAFRDRAAALDLCAPDGRPAAVSIAPPASPPR